MSRQSNRQTSTSAGTSDWLLGALKQNPEGLLLLAAGAALLLRSGAGGSSIRRASAGDSFAGAASDVTNYAQSYAAGATRQAGNYASDAASYAGDVAERTKQAAGSLAASAYEAADQARRAVGEHSERFLHQAQSTFSQAQSSLQGTVNRMLRDQPLLVAAAGLAAGAALAAAFPATDFERENLGPIGERLTDAAGQVGEQLKEATARAGETLKNAADERGLSSEGLKEVASEVAGAFSGSMSGEAEPTGGSIQSGSPQSGASTRPGPTGRSG
jgi:hypothetical protein